MTAEVIGHVSAVALTVLLYLLLGAAYFGWGRAATHLLGIKALSDSRDITLVWFGWALTLLAFHFLHLFVSITIFVVAPVLIVGAVFCVAQLIGSGQVYFWRRRKLRTRVPFLVVALTMVAWIASRAMLPPTNYDSGLYHFGAIRWINTFAIVPGLGNLYGPLAYNQTFFTYVAALNFHPLFGHGRSLANSFLLLLTIASFLHFLRPVFRRPSLLLESHPFQYPCVLFAFPVLALVAPSGDGLASPTPDLASSLLQLTMFVLLAQGIAAWIDGEKRQDYRATLLAILAITAITIKLSNLAFSLVILSMCLTFSWRTSGGDRRAVLRILSCVSFVTALWVISGFILSGYPLFPSTIGQLPVDWAVPRQIAAYDATRIYTWARHPGADSRDVQESWQWLGPWTKRMSRDIGGVMYPVASAIALCAIAACLHKRAWRRSPEWTILPPVLTGLAYWFVTAPDPRFAHALFGCLTLSGVVLLLSTSQPLLSKRRWAVVMAGLFLVANLHVFSAAIKAGSTVKNISLSGWWPVPTVPLTQRTTASGLVIFTPENPASNQCWDSPLPCAPSVRFNPDLGLRISGKLASGFSVRADRR